MIEDNLLAFIDARGLTLHAFAKELNAALASNVLGYRKAISAQTLYNWAKGKALNHAQLRILATYVVYGDALRSITLAELDLKKIAQVERDLQLLPPTKFRILYSKPLSNVVRARYFIYGLYADAIASERHNSDGVPIGMIGAYVLDQDADGTAIIEWGRVWFAFPQRQVFRGAWTSDRYAESGGVVFFRFYMHERGSIFSETLGNYYGVITMVRNGNRPIVGQQSWHGEFYDLNMERSHYRGRIYAEEVKQFPVESFSQDQFLSPERFIARAKEN